MRLALVDGLAIEDRLFLCFYRRVRSRAVAAFSPAYGDDLPPDFWRRPVGGMTPQAAAKEWALEAFRPYACAARVLEAAGVLPSIPAEARLLAAWQAENARRAADAVRGAPVYGPVSIDVLDFVDHRFRQALLLGRERLGADAFDRQWADRQSSCVIEKMEKNWVSYFPESSLLSGAKC